MLQHGTRRNVQRYIRMRKQQTHFFQEKRRRLEEAESEQMELLCRSQETRKFYQKLNAPSKGFVSRAEMCRDKDGSILMDGREVIERWKKHFDEHLNDAGSSDMNDQGSGRNDYVSTKGTIN